MEHTGRTGSAKSFRYVKIKCAYSDALIPWGVHPHTRSCLLAGRNDAGGSVDSHWNWEFQVETKQEDGDNAPHITTTYIEHHDDVSPVLPRSILSGLRFAV